MQLRPIAKAIAAALTPVLVAALTRALEWVGADVPVDPGWVETVVVSVVTAVAVWATRNGPKRDEFDAIVEGWGE